MVMVLVALVMDLLTFFPTILIVIKVASTMRSKRALSSSLHCNFSLLVFKLVKTCSFINTLISTLFSTFYEQPIQGHPLLQPHSQAFHLGHPHH